MVTLYQNINSFNLIIMRIKTLPYHCKMNKSTIESTTFIAFSWMAFELLIVFLIFLGPFYIKRIKNNFK